MQEPRGLEPQSASTEPELEPHYGGGEASRGLMRDRRLLVALVIAIAVAAFLLDWTGEMGIIASVLPLTAIPRPEAVLSAPALVQPKVAEPAPAPTPIPTPAPTPDPNIRPLTAPVLPRTADVGPAPVRRPGTPDPNPSTQHVVVVDGYSGAILFQRNGYEPIAPASLTKIMTAILGIQHGNMADHVPIDVDAGSMAGSSLMGLEPGFDVTFQDLLYGLMLPSGNDAALAIARYVAGSDERFVRLMNEEADWLGLRCTHFVNPHGLDTPDHYSCPIDMVTMARYAMQYPIFRKVVNTHFYDVQGSNISYQIQNVNPLLNAYSGADGVKTGDTDNAGRALVGTAVDNGHRVYVAFMRSENGAASDGALLLNWAFNSFQWPKDDNSSDWR
jgi:D-alanyl-D-alanine carboxypeptidase